MSNKKRVSSEQMAAMLQQPHFVNTSQTSANLPSTDPITTMPMVLEVMQVKTYDKNPRKAPNSEYSNLYESIKINGLDQALTITKRPGDAEYMVYSGGNTRLKIIQELWTETQDLKYKTANFLFKPWEKEENTLLAHLRENDQRGELNFIDRANALIELRTLLKEEGSVTSDNQFANYIKQAGYRIARQHLSIYWFAAEELYEWLPNLLNNGMGRDKVRLIYRYKQAFITAWLYLVEDANEEDGKLYFYTVVEKLDEPDNSSFDDKQFWDELIEALCAITNEATGTCGIVLAKALKDKNSLTKPLSELTKPDTNTEANSVDPVSPLVEVPADTSSNYQEQKLPAPKAIESHSFNFSDTQEDLDSTTTETYDVPEPEVSDTFTEESLPVPKTIPNHTLNFSEATESESLDSDNKITSSVQEQEQEQENSVTSSNATESNADVTQEEVTESGYSYAVAQMLSLPLPKLPSNIDELRSTSYQLAQQLIENSGLNPNLVQEIPDGAGFYLLPISNQSKGDLEAESTSKRWLFALHTWLELSDFSGQFALGSQAHKYLLKKHTDAYPAFSEAMQQAETSEVAFSDYSIEDWGNLEKEGVPYLSGWLGREMRTQRFFGNAELLSRQNLATYFQLIEVYRELTSQLKGNLWEVRDV